MRGQAVAASTDTCRWVARPEELREVNAAGVEFAGWRRRLPRGLETPLTRWAKHAPDRREWRIEAASLALPQALHGLGDPARRWILQDVERLLRRFTQIARRDAVLVSLGVVRGDQCRKFHVDYLHLRMICTYLGPGTEWIPAADVHRHILDDPPACHEQANQEIARRAGCIQRASAGDVLLLKGERHDGGGLGVVHRSPPIEHTGALRVVLIASALERP